MKLLVTGGAGYIGSIMAAYFMEAGHEVVIVDDLSRGDKAAVPAGCRFIQADISRLGSELSPDDGIDAVVHLAALAAVGESMSQPDAYWQHNAGGTVALLDAMRQLGVSKLVFASSCAAYGIPQQVPITEDAPTNPVNTYGMTKLACDMAITSYARAYGMSAVSLRFFNVAGAYKTFGERHDPESHIIPIALAVAAGDKPQFSLFGDDYDTPDGSCIRDYIHVLDLADAVLSALDRMPQDAHTIYNLGNGDGYSNKQVISVVEEVTGTKLKIVNEPRRPGDPPKLVASNDRIKRDLGWAPKRPELRDMVQSAWDFYKATH